MLVLFSYIYQRWKIADFGATSEATSEKLCQTSTRRGTAIYRGPEVIKSGGFNNKSDIWAFGCIAYELCTKEKAFRGDWEILSYGISEQLTPKWIFDEHRWPQGKAAVRAGDLARISVENTLRFKWKERPSAEEIWWALNGLKLKV
jgi:serine/threonine protein kinase